MYPEDSALNYESDDVVAFFSLPYEALSNWSAHRVEIGGRQFSTAEHAFQFAKFKDSASLVAEEIAEAPSPWAVYQLAKQHKNKRDPNWETRKDVVMAEIVRAKVDQNKDVQERLISTGTKRIIENSPWDEYWGVGPNGDGKNMLGTILMQIRSELRAKKQI